MSGSERADHGARVHGSPTGDSLANTRRIAGPVGRGGPAQVDPARPARIEVAAASDRGQVRPENEDDVRFEPPESPAARLRGILSVVADGMGGHAAGEVASGIAVETVLRAYYDAGAPPAAALRAAVEAANSAIWQQARRQPDQQGMGCTLTAAVVSGGELTIGHVGDSRAYLVRGERAVQLTADHTWVAERVRDGDLSPAEARSHPRRHVLTRALGFEPTVQIDLLSRAVSPGDTVVLCTDGLHDVVSDGEIGYWTNRFAPEAAARSLVRLANQRGAPDNVTVAVVRLGAGRRGLGALIGRRAPLIAAVLAAGLAVTAFVANQWTAARQDSPARETARATASEPTLAPTSAPTLAPTPAPTALPPTAPPAPAAVASPPPGPSLAPSSTALGPGSRARVAPPAGANLRQEPGPRAALVDALRQGIEVEIVAVADGEAPPGTQSRRWLEVTVQPPGDGRKGYLHGSVVEPVGGSPTPAPSSTARP